LALWPVDVWAGVAALVAAGVTPLAVGASATRMLGGVTGDVLGATAVLTQLGALLAVVAVLG
ncbi:MAG: adenosylcobinamide-GDP ribazoletransferase, partial [Arsenicicoccus sp.]